MDICLPELGQTDDELSTAEQLLADTWVIFWAKPDVDAAESERAAHSLCAALPLVTSEEARLN